MIRFLVAVDGSENSIRAVDYLASHLDRYKDEAEIHLINVQPALSDYVTRFIPSQTIHEYHEEQGVNALAPAQARLNAAGVRHAVHIGTGEPGAAIANYAREIGAEQIFMGTRGLGQVTGMFLGSVATKVVHLSSVPVTLIK